MILASLKTLTKPKWRHDDTHNAIHNTVYLFYINFFYLFNHYHNHSRWYVQKKKGRDFFFSEKEKDTIIFKRFAVGLARISLHACPPTFVDCSGSVVVVFEFVPPTTSFSSLYYRKFNSLLISWPSHKKRKTKQNKQKWEQKTDNAKKWKKKWKFWVKSTSIEKKKIREKMLTSAVTKQWQKWSDWKHA